MAFIRLHLRAWSLIWLSCQVASLSALVPPDVWSLLRPLEQGLEECQRAVPAEQCPMHSADGEPCPMHQGTGGGEKACALRNWDKSPEASLVSLFSIPGVLTDVLAELIEDAGAVPPATVDSFANALVALDTPPPRA